MKVRKVAAWIVLVVAGAFVLLAAGVKYGWGTPLLVLFAIAAAWALHEVMRDE